jgi:hypothetical protein
MAIGMGIAPGEHPRQQWPGSSSQNNGGLNKHYFQNTCPNEATEVFIGIYVKCGCLFVIFKDHTLKLWRSKVVGGFYPQWLRDNVYLVPTLGRETKAFLTVGEGPCQKSYRLIWVRQYGRQTHPKPNGTTSMGIGLT